jgi:hypothetical protein
LPLITTAVRGSLGMLRTRKGKVLDRSAGADSELEMLITDFVGAFWQVPLHMSERRYFVIKFQGVFLVFLRTAQGSRGAPLSWAAVASLIGRVLQSLFVTDAGEEGRLQIYVDDPLLALKGAGSRRRLLAARFIAVSMVLGTQLAFEKAQFGQDIVWIGVQLTLGPELIKAAIPRDKLLAIRAIICEMQTQNVVPLKQVRSLAGKGTNIASLIFAWRPFLSQLWAVLSTEQTNAPMNCAWTKQFETTLAWLLAFIDQQSGTTVRTFTLAAAFGTVTSVEVTCDASIYGFGGWLAINGRPLQWFSDDICASDEEALGYKGGDPLGQQAFEALCILIACRLWSRLWRDRKVCFKLRSDNMGALTLFSSLKAAPGAMNLIAREYALDAAECAYEPDVVAHLPGVANKVADILSRRRDPKFAGVWAPPEFLQYSERVTPPPRSLKWWRARVAPRGAFSGKVWGAQS